MSKARKGDKVTIPQGTMLWSRLGGVWKRTGVTTQTPDVEALVEKLDLAPGSVEIATVKVHPRGELYTVDRSALKPVD